MSQVSLPRDAKTEAAKAERELLLPASLSSDPLRSDEPGLLSRINNPNSAELSNPFAFSEPPGFRAERHWSENEVDMALDYMGDLGVLGQAQYFLSSRERLDFILTLIGPYASREQRAEGRRQLGLPPEPGTASSFFDAPLSLRANFASLRTYNAEAFSAPDLVLKKKKEELDAVNEAPPLPTYEN